MISNVQMLRLTSSFVGIHIETKEETYKMFCKILFFASSTILLYNFASTNLLHALQKLNSHSTVLNVITASSGTSNGNTYDSLYEPRLGGSRGGSSSNRNTLGSRGGSVIRIKVGKEIMLDGVLDARAADASSNAGGGSGGSVWISAGDSLLAKNLCW